MAHVIFVNVIFLWIAVNVANLEMLTHEGEYKNSAFKKGHLTCVCGNSGQFVEKDLNIKYAKNIFRSVMHGKDFLKKIKTFPEFKEFEDCSRCDLTYINCSKDLCIKKAVAFSLQQNGDLTVATESSKILPMSYSAEIKNNESSITTATAKSDEIKYNTVNDSKIDADEINDNHVLEVIDIPVGGDKNHSRQQRNVGCSYPTSMETSAISCRVYPSSIKCAQHCIFGYTLESGIRKEMQCSFKENRWIPSGFKECQPFVDCSVTLTSGGSVKCGTASIETAPYCNIECMYYEDKPAVPMAEYTCKIDGTWEPPLPFCAVAGTGLMLAPPPKVKLDTDQKD